MAPLPVAARFPWGTTAGGPYAPIVLLAPAGARTLAMGNTGVASRDDDVLFFNPAQVAIARGFSISGERYSSSAAGGSLSAVTRFNNTGGIAIGMRFADYELPFDVFPADRGTMLGAGAAHGTSLEAIAGIAQVFKGFRVGLAGKYIEDVVPTARVSSGAADVGISRDVFRFYTIGLSVQNIGPSTTIPCSFEVLSITPCPIPPVPGGGAIIETTTAKLPLRTTLGVATQRALGRVRRRGDGGALGAARGLSLRERRSRTGLQLARWLRCRGACRRAAPALGEKPFTAGAGFTMDRLSIDYALETLTEWRALPGGIARSSSRVGHRIGLRIR